MTELPSPRTYRPNVMGSHFMVSTGHYLATAGAAQILHAGGNAIDAGVAAGLCINVVQPEFTNLGGVAPIVLYSARDDVVRTISGLGCWPAAVDPDYFRIECDGAMPPGVKRSVVPAAVDAWLTALKLFGTRSLAEVAAPAIALAEGGFPVYSVLHTNLSKAASLLATWPSSAAVFLPGGRVPEVGRTPRPARARRDPAPAGRSRTGKPTPGTRERDPGSARPLLQGRHRASGLPPSSPPRAAT